MSTPKLSLSRMEEYCAKATPGPWDAPLVDLPPESGGPFDHNFESYPPLGYAGPVFVANTKENAAFCATARTDFPALLSWAKRAREQLEQGSVFVDHHHGYQRCQTCEEWSERAKKLLEECGE